MKCPKCGAEVFEVFTVYKTGPDIFERYKCFTCLYKWNPYDKERVVFT